MTRSGLGRRGFGLLALITISSLCLGTTALARRLGDKTKRDQLLETLEKSLEKRGINIVVGDASGVKMRTNARPRVARLDGMPTPDPDRDWTKAPWMREFETGMSGFVGGVKAPDHASELVTGARTQESFLIEWNKASSDHRVFLSFTSEDKAHAHAVAKALEDAGYVTFVFLRASDERPTFDAAFVGRMFAEAGHRMVIDTSNARESKGVWFEARIARGNRPPDGDHPGSPSSPGGSFDDGKGPGSGTSRRGGQAAADSVSNPEMDRFLRGVDAGWIVTENPSTPGKLFVHRSSSGGMLSDLVYLVKVEKDGSWTVYRPKSGGSGSKYGKAVGKTEAPSSVSVGSCTCM